MAFVEPITINEAIGQIHKNNFVLPAIQREFVWDTEQIELLFDSLMRDYPISSFLFWFVEQQNVKDFQFYEFLREYHERDSTHNQKASVSGNESVTAILDGQQRLTALYIGLRGSYTYKMPRKRWDNDSAFPKRKLYLNLLVPSPDTEREYDFRFLTITESKKKNNGVFWFPVEDILTIDEPHKPNEYLITNGLNTLPQEQALFANKTIFKLQKVIHDSKLINFFLEKDESLDKVLNIFIRVNSGGTQLSYSDLLLSIATAQWQTRDAREVITEFVDMLNQVGDGFGFSKDFVLKSCLVLSDFKDVAFKVDNFNAANMHFIEKKWDEISEAIKEAVTLVSSFGFHRDTLTSANALIPIAYYLLKAQPTNFAIASKHQKEREGIFKWLLIVLLKRTFSGQPDNVLRPIRSIISDHHATGFPLDQISDSLRGSPKSIIFTHDEIESLLALQYGKPHTFSSLAAVYPTLDFRNRFHQDHIFPKRLFTPTRLRKHGIPESKIEFYLGHYNSLANLQFLEGIPNQEKSGKLFEDWLTETFKDAQERSDYMRKHFIPQGISLSLDNFEQFIKERGRLLVEKFSTLLKI